MKVWSARLAQRISSLITTCMLLRLLPDNGMAAAMMLRQLSDADNIWRS